jgi:hypothetical protein
MEVAMKIEDVLSGRAKSSGIRRFLSSATTLKVLADQLRMLLPAETAVGPWRAKEVRSKPGRKLTAYYDVTINTASPRAHYVRPVAVTWGQNAHADRHEETATLARMQAATVRRGVAAPFRKLMADSPVWRMRVWVSPLDARFTQLVRLADPQYVRAMLAETKVAASARGRSGDYTVTHLKYRPGKSHVLRYDPVDPGAGAIFAKLYIPEDQVRAFRREDAARAFRVANKAADWLAEHGDEARGLRPLAWVAGDAVVLYPEVVGVPLSDYARQSAGEVAQWLERAGVALRILHQMPAAQVGPLGSPHDFAAEIRLIEKKSTHIPALLPRVWSAIEALLDRAREVYERLPQEPVTFTHGDLKCEHIWVSAGQLVLMDFDTCHLADPAIDVGCFLADWQFSHATADRAGLARDLEHFLAAYSAGVPQERLLRARLYEATGLVKCAVRRVQLFEHDWAARTAGLVRRAQSLINGLQSTLGMSRGPPSNGFGAQNTQTVRGGIGGPDASRVPGLNHG